MPASPEAQRYPAVPLLTHDPYFSVWSFTDRLTDDDTRHWTGARHGLIVVLRIDGQLYRLAGAGDTEIPTLQQCTAQVQPTTTRYCFTGAGVAVELAFVSPLLPDDLDLLARPVSYVTWEVSATDGRAHQCALCLGVSMELAVDQPAQAVRWGRHRLEGLQVLSCWHEAQPVLGRAGDNLRIDWGTLYLAVPDSESQTWAGARALALEAFAATGCMPAFDDLAMPQPVLHGWGHLWTASDLGAVTVVAQHGRVLVAYDDCYAIEYLERKLRPYWRRNGWGATELLMTAQREADDILTRACAFDARMMEEAARVGGTGYAALCALAYRQCLAAHKLCADVDGTPLFFSKENFSNGCIATVDVTFPSAPLFLLEQPELLRAMLTPMLDYARTSRWRFPFAPHDLGTYPLANGQVYGGGESSPRDQMPVEECGNLLLLMAGLARATGDLGYVRRYWSLLSQWAEYLRGNGLDPAEQLCTDDFAGHLGHNANLALKAILALGGYAQMAESLSEADDARTYRLLAESWASEWLRMADDGDHTRLAFDCPGTWSQKYNLVWDRLLALHLFPATLAQRELVYYQSQSQRYGLPLDSRQTYTKLDWILWLAALAETEEAFAVLVDPVVRWLHDTPSRVPLTDWYDTITGVQVGFQARSVVGGLFLPVLLRRAR